MDVYGTAHRGSGVGNNGVWVGLVCGCTHYTMGWLSSTNYYIVWVGRVCGCI